MIARVFLLSVCLSAIVACSGEASLTDETEIRSIASAFAIKKGMTLLCEGDDVDYLTPFMEDLRQAGVLQVHSIDAA